MDLERKVRAVEEILGVEVSIRYTQEGYPIGLVCNDWELRGKRFECDLSPPSKYRWQVDHFHARIYKERGQEVFRRQRGLCGICGGKMAGTSNTEIDHIETRGAHGRSDVMSNLRAVHGNPCHRKRHGG